MKKLKRKREKREPFFLNIIDILIEGFEIFLLFFRFLFRSIIKLFDFT
ncbi:hypothetical protein [Bacillus sp. B1-b2]|nr:hypothetical protein [Bacillus sp. B1-b2]